MQGHLIIDVASRQAFVEGKEVRLQKREFDMLAMLALRREGTAIVVEHVRRLRRPVERDPRHQRFIQTLQRRGYRFNLGPLIAS